MPSDLSKSDLEIINQSIKKTDFVLDKDHFDISMCINSNKAVMLSAIDVSKICDYKIRANSNSYDESSIYFKSFFNTAEQKELLYRKTKKNISECTQGLQDIESNIVYLKNSLNESNIVKEIYNIFQKKNPSKFFARTSNYIIQEIINNKENNFSSEENNYLSKNQENYYNFLDYDLFSSDSLKKFFLVSFEEENKNYSSFNIDTFICQSFINLAQSMSTLSTGVISNFYDQSSSFVNLVEENNYICETRESDNINYFSYISENNLNFNYSYFKDNEIDSNVTYLESNNISSWITHSVNNKNSSSLISSNSSSLISSNNTSFSSLNILKVNAKRKSKIFDEFYKKFSRVDDSGKVVFLINDIEDVDYRSCIEEIDLSLEDIKSVDLSKISQLNIVAFNKYIFNQSFLGNNNLYSTDFVINENYFADQVSAITSLDFFIRNKIDSIINNDVNANVGLNVCIALQVLNNNLRKSIGQIYVGNSLINDISYPSLTNNNNVFSGEENSLKTRGLDYQKLMCDNVASSSIKIDTLVKKIKIKSLENKNVNFDVLKELVKNIKNKKTKSKLISYSPSNFDNVQLISNDQRLQKVLYAKDENNYYSNYRLKENRSSFSKTEGLINRLLAGISNSDIENELDNINNIIKNYYKGNYLRSSISFLRNIMSDVFDESLHVSGDNIYFKKSLLQYLYLFYFKNSKNKTAKDKVVKRFIEKTILKHADCGSSLYGQTSYKFNAQEIKATDYKIEIASNEEWQNKKLDSLRSFQKDISKTNTSYKEIQDTIFSIDNISKISKEFNYKKADNIDISLDILESFRKNKEKEIENREINIEDIEFSDNFSNIIRNTFSQNTFSINFNILYSFLPFYYKKEKTKINSQQKTGIGALSFNLIHDYFGSDLFKKDENITVENYTDLEKIRLSLYLNSRKNNNVLEIEDYFDDIIDDNKFENYIFKKICIVIDEMLNVLSIDRYKEKFNSIEEVSSFIEENNYIVDYVFEIIEAYALIYDVYIKKMHHDLSMKMLVADIAFSDNVDNTQSEYSDFNLSQNLLRDDIENRRVNSIKEEWDLVSKKSNKTRNDIENIISENNINNILGDMKAVFQEIQEFNSISNVKSTTKTSEYTYIDQLRKICSIIMNSDVVQAINFDIVKFFLLYHENSIKDLDINFLISNLADTSSFININNLISNLYNEFYLNNLKSNIQYLHYINNIFNKDSETLHSSEAFFGQEKIFEEIKKIDEKSFLRLANKELSSSILNGDIYTTNISLDEINLMSKDNILKISINIVDHSRLDRIFIPKVLLFSPLIFNPGTKSLNNEQPLGFYKTEAFSERLEYYNDFESLKEISLLRNIINKKFNFEDIISENVESNIDYIIEHIGNCHINSNVIEDFTNVVYNINIDENQSIAGVNSNIYNMINSLSTEKFIDIFEVEKKDVTSLLEIDENGLYNISNKNKPSIIKFLHVVNIMSEKENFKKLLDNKTYMNINFSLLPEDFVYFVQSKINDSNEESLENTSLLQTLGDSYKLSCLLENIDLDVIQSNNLYKITNTSEIDNYSVSVDIEVI